MYIYIYIYIYIHSVQKGLIPPLKKHPPLLVIPPFTKKCYPHLYFHKSLTGTLHKRLYYTKERYHKPIIYNYNTTIIYSYNTTII